jgi:hypothetical protein
MDSTLKKGRMLSAYVRVLGDQKIKVPSSWKSSAGVASLLGSQVQLNTVLDLHNQGVMPEAEVQKIIDAYKANAQNLKENKPDRRVRREIKHAMMGIEDGTKTLQAQEAAQQEANAKIAETQNAALAEALKSAPTDATVLSSAYHFGTQSDTSQLRAPGADPAGIKRDGPVNIPGNVYLQANYGSNVKDLMAIITIDGKESRWWMKREPGVENFWTSGKVPLKPGTGTIQYVVTFDFGDEKPHVEPDPNPFNINVTKPGKAPAAPELKPNQPPATA